MPRGGGKEKNAGDTRKSLLSIHLKKGLEENLKGGKSQVFQGRASTPSYAQKKSHSQTALASGEEKRTSKYIPIPPLLLFLMKRKEKNKIGYINYVTVKATGKRTRRRNEAG